MATTREVQLKVTALAEGGSSIADLAAKIDALTKEGEQASPAFVKLSEDLQQLANQQALIVELNKIRETAAATAAELVSAQAKVATLGETLQKQVSASAEFSAAQTSIKDALQQTAIEIKQTQGALKTLRESNDSAAKGTAEYKAQVIALNETLTNLNVKQIEQKASQEKIDTATSAAAKALRAMNSEYQTAERGATGLNDKLNTQTSVLNKVEGELKAAGLSATNLASAQALVTQGVNAATVSYEKSAKAVQDLVTAQKQAAAAETAAVARAAATLASRNAEIAALERTAKASLEAAAAQKAYAASVQETLSNAFGATGVRSLETINAEAKKVEASLQHIASEFKSGGISAESFSRAVAGAKVQLAALDKEAKTLPALPGVFERISTAVGTTISRFAGLGAAVATVGFAVKPVFDLAIQVDSLQRALKTITGTSSEANAQLEFLRKTADYSGLSFTGTADSFVKFTASMRTAGISSADTQKVFAATANAAGNLGLSTDKTSHILDALGQMASKGVVSMEELRQQLGESLPGAMGLMAKGLGITQAQLIKLVESGKLLTSDALVPLANAMTELGSKDKQVEGLGASFARLGNAVTKAMQSATDSNAFKSLAGVIDGVAKNFSTLVDVTVAFGKAMLAIKLVSVISSFLGMGNAAKVAAVEIQVATLATEKNSVATVANSTATTANTVAKKASAVANAEVAASASTAAVAQGKLAKASTGLGAAMGGLPGIALALLFNIKDLGTALGEGAAKMMGYGKVLAEAERQMKAAEDRAKELALEQTKLGESAVKLAVAYSEALPAVEANVKSSARLAEAKKIEGESMVRIAELSGSEVSRLLAEAKASDENASATQRSADAKTQEVELLDTYIIKMEQSIKIKGTATDAEKKLIETSGQKLQVLQAEAEALKQSADADAQRAVSAKATAAAYADNTSRLGELREASLNAQAALTLMTNAAATGEVATGALARAASNAAVAQKLYRDAIADSVVEAGRMKDGAAFMNQAVGESKVTLDASAKAAANYADKLAESTNMIRSQISVLKEALKSNQELAAAHGDTSGKLAKESEEIRKLITAKEQEVEVSRRATAASKDDAAAKEIAAAAYKDNSGAVATYSGNLKIAQEELRKVTEAHKAGKASMEDVADATRKVSTAMALYKDALHDTTVAMQGHIQLEKAYATQLAASNNLDQERERTIEAVARAKGDEAAVTQSLIRQKELEKTARGNNAGAMRDEADAEIGLANQYRDELEKTGQLTPEKENEIRVRIANAEAKKTEAAASNETTKQIDAEIEALKRLATQKKANQGVDKDGWVTGTDGKKIEMADPSDPKTPATRRADGRWNYTGSDRQWHISNRMPIQDKDGNWIDPDGSAGFITLENDTTQPKLGGGSGGGLNANVNTSTKAASATTSSTHTVNITLGGQSQSVGVASEADGQALSNFLKRLTTDKSRG